ncbi:gliding motility-associated peptidyl-prolyl isomerase GldI [Polaribacter sp. R77954]|uniref:gliding motility-associated peptidyl-prolyl isomerase GldI n=1 Tax=Polaribacter sp. R77954 TaxID=3093870 RepID=UPI0037C8A5EF
MKYSFLVILVFVSFSCTKIQPRKPINPKPSTTLYFEAMQQNKRLNKIEDDKILALIKKDSTRTYIQSTSGFWYTYLHKIEENLPTPTKGDEVVLEYEILDLRDSILYSKKELGIKNYIVDEEDFISGLQKGIKLMKIGETITFVLPSYSAYGITGDNNKIGLNQSIKSTVTLINIK